MIREHLFHKRAPADPMFRWRGGEVSRLEGLSDGVFAVTLTLLIISLSVPSTFYELFETVRDLPVFLACFAALMMAWHYHYIFFRRYGLEDFLTASLNAAFLFLILFYAYPLKFLVSFLWGVIRGEGTAQMFSLPADVDPGSFFANFEQRAGMMYFYGFGVIGVFAVLALLTLRAYSLRKELSLDDLECYLTLASVRTHLITVGIALLSIVILALTKNPGLSGVTYFLMGPLHAANGIVSGRKAKRLRATLDPQA